MLNGEGRVHGSWIIVHGRCSLRGKPVLQDVEFYFKPGALYGTVGEKNPLKFCGHPRDLREQEIRNKIKNKK
jgi:hypothetical protein